MPFLHIEAVAIRRKRIAPAYPDGGSCSSLQLENLRTVHVLWVGDDLHLELTALEEGPDGLQVHPPDPKRILRYD